MWTGRGATRNGALRSEARRPSPPFSPDDLFSAPLHDFPIRDEILYAYFSLSPEMDILEIGPGSGFTAFRLARQVRSVTLVDVAEECLAELRNSSRQSANIHYVCADISQPGLAEKVGRRFDGVYGLDVFEYVLDPVTCLRNLAEVLKPGAELLLSYPNLPPPVGDGVNYFSRRAELESLLKKAGFQRWDVFSVRLGTYARFIYLPLHEWPLRLYRHLRGGNRGNLPQTYERTWAFRQRRKMNRYRLPLNSFWLLLERAMRAGGNVFRAEPVADDVRGLVLVVRAWK